MRIKDGTFSATEAGNLDGTQTAFPFTHPSDFVLTSFQRFPGDEATDNQRVIEKIRHRSFRS